ncbi:MAG: hypothetical protein RL414_487 [Actinomycetota bacterium]|jgi:Holliday junction DNA helicase RuvA
MIAMVTGVVKASNLNSVIVDVNGFGMVVHVSPRLSASLLVGSQAHLHTTLIVREDSMTLFGFESATDRELFELLQTVTGIGPKVAQSALALYDAPEIVSAIMNEESALLERIPGLGKKGAQRLLLELKEKVKGFAASPSRYQSGWRTQLENALLGLGFTARDTDSALEAVAEEFGSDITNTDISVLLRSALQSQGRK